ncbi:Predicted PurR-regulated permease PerM [Halogranum amylolyticum]|uniref:Predicted PurR-regulated permease PerM n=1 Tax=Halogranum amylolyticum TaxID=660520 RepID=A0A1H8RHT4_9EURY|nr:AI-2E family transporter [Halogranum amylolyticum]SEO65872.1 Predicted PurR-regulated permease PerM [Halogranum amylolyticum]
MTSPSRNRLGWWLYILALAGATLFLTYSFIDILVLGVFGYYATRPVCDRFSRVVDSDRIAAALTIAVVLLPALLLVIYASTQVFQQLQHLVGGSSTSMLVSRVFGLDALSAAERAQLLSTLENPLSGSSSLQGSLESILRKALQAVQMVFGAVVLLALSVTLSYALLERDEALSKTVVALVGGRDTTAYAYAVTVDNDLESVFFGNLLFVAVMAVIATVLYGATNYLAPQGLQIPMVLTLGVLTGLTSLIPIVVGKVVYLPVVALLGLQATRAAGNHLLFVGGVLAVYALVLDILPQSVIQPYLSGRKFDTILLLFAYVLGPVLFGWYGFFFLPIVVVLLFEAVRIVLPQLLRGDPLGPEPMLAEEVGANPQESRDGTFGGSDSDGDTNETAADGCGAESDEL